MYKVHTCICTHRNHKINVYQQKLLICESYPFSQTLYITYKHIRNTKTNRGLARHEISLSVKHPSSSVAQYPHLKLWLLMLIDSAWVLTSKTADEVINECHILTTNGPAVTRIFTSASEMVVKYTLGTKSRMTHIPESIDYEGMKLTLMTFHIIIIRKHERSVLTQMDIHQVRSNWCCRT